MIDNIWINLPVKNPQASKEFFTKIGFVLNPMFNNGDDSISLFAGTNKIVVMLFKDVMFKNFTGNDIADTKNGSEVLFSLGLDSKEKIDELAHNVTLAGGKVYAEPEETGGWMYGCGFTDLDGHRWNGLYMDMDKMPQG